MLRKLLSIILSITLSIIFCFSSTFAKSDKLNSSNWFVDIKYGEAISKTSKIDDHESTLSRTIINSDEKYVRRFLDTKLGISQFKELTVYCPSS